MAEEVPAPPPVTVCVLPERLDTMAAPHLKNLLEKSMLDAAGMDVVLDATHVRYLGGAMFANIAGKPLQIERDFRRIKGCLQPFWSAARFGTL